MTHIEYPDGQAEVVKFTNGGRGREELFTSSVHDDERYGQRVHVVDTQDLTPALDLAHNADPAHCQLYWAGHLHSRARHELKVRRHGG